MSRDEQIEPFTIDIDQAEIDDLRARLSAARWAPEAPDADWVRGVPTAYLRELAAYWRDEYDWRAAERELNACAQYRTVVGGQQIHFLHVRSPENDAMPLLLTHGWPGSVAEFTQVLGPLTDPAAYGGDPGDAFHVVAPSLPGFAFSGPVTEPGWDAGRIAEAFAELMARLGYASYAAQGGDWGSHVARQIARVDAGHVLGIHLNMLMNRPSRRDPEQLELTDDERERVAGLDAFQADGAGYQGIQSTRPQTLAHALVDSPVGLLAWIVEKFHAWTDLRGIEAARPEDAVDRDQLLTNVALYWFTRTAGSAAEIYYESARGRGRDPEAVSDVPTGVAVFPGDIARPVRRIAEQRDRIVHWTELERGGHFAAMEQPEALVDDVRRMFRALR